MSSTENIQHVSDTALWVASYRAAETRRPDALFRDPLAEVLLGERGIKIAESMKATSRYSSWTLIMRTLVIDEYLRKYLAQGYRTVINLGAGLDTRPYRLDLPADVQWIEIDFPHMIEMKNEKLKNEAPRCRLERIALDLSVRSKRKNLFDEIDRRPASQAGVIVMTEGVVPYLTQEMVFDLAQDLRNQPNFKLWIAEYYAPQLYKRFQAQSFRKRLGNSPFQFFPPDWFGFFNKAGWKQKEIRFLNDEGDKVGRKFPLPFPLSLLRFVLNPARLNEKLRVQGYVVMEKS